MKVKLQSSQTAFAQTANFCWLPGLAPTPAKPQASTWVHLLEPPSAFSYDEALLICQQSEDAWLAWVPEHGEVVLHVNQFCLAA
ncbi:MAG TPA: hypothetical protein V6D16_11815 [Candidatus Obscuribacterales bacterium]